MANLAMTSMSGSLMSLMGNQPPLGIPSSCSVHDNGCAGGYARTAFNFIQTNGGITTEENYPYKAVQGEYDPSKAKGFRVPIDAYGYVARNNEAALRKVVASQPVTVRVDARSSDFRSYSEGVFTGKCGTELNHAMAVVGYGTDPHGIKYWLAKNSYGPESGDIKIERGTADPRGRCGIAMDPWYPLNFPLP